MNCGPPSSPTNGYIIPHTSTFEGAIVTYVCWNIHHGVGPQLQCREVNMTAVCTKQGYWESSTDDIICAEPNKGTC